MLTEQVERKESAKTILDSVFGYNSFRDNQAEVIDAILDGRDVFTSMPTGGGKSLCYQIPGIIFEGLTVVISPLIALMKDQVDDACSKGISAAFLNSTLAQDEISKIYSRLYRNELKILYISPERLAIEGYAEKLKEFNVSFFAIDEAHCLSEWGHDFRPNYLFLSKLREYFPLTPIAAFTATATEKVQHDIINILNLRNPFTVRASFNRQELYYEVQSKTEVLSQISEFIKEHPDQSGIVYRISRKDVDKTAAFLKSRGIKALHYHAGLTKEERTQNQELFNNDKIDVIVATTAFGMGINKNNIRFVIHGDLPKSMEGYYQETGRAGRDSIDSICLLFFGMGDIVKQQYFIDQIENPQEREKCRNNLNSLVNFATVNVCRRKQILKYFGEDHPGDCKNCDVCNDVSEKTEATIDAQKILSAIVRTKEGFGINHIIDIVWGADTEKIRSKDHHNLKTFGVGRDKSKKWWRNIVNELIGQQLIYRNNERYNVLSMTEEGRRILFGEGSFYISETFGISKKTEIDKDDKILTPSIFSGNEILDKGLFKKLKERRSKLAQESRVPPYIIFSDKTLSEMAKIKPENKEEFLQVSGVGEIKKDKYGASFLEVIREYEQ